jgi:hypothetical protein
MPPKRPTIERRKSHALNDTIVSSATGDEEEMGGQAGIEATADIPK